MSDDEPTFEPVTSAQASNAPDRTARSTDQEPRRTGNVVGTIRWRGAILDALKWVAALAVVGGVVSGVVWVSGGLASWEPEGDQLGEAFLATWGSTTLAAWLGASVVGGEWPGGGQRPPRGSIGFGGWFSCSWRLPCLFHYS